MKTNSESEVVFLSLIYFLNFNKNVIEKEEKTTPKITQKGSAHREEKSKRKKQGFRFKYIHMQFFLVERLRDSW